MEGRPTEKRCHKVYQSALGPEHAKALYYLELKLGRPMTELVREAADFRHGLLGMDSLRAVRDPAQELRRLQDRQAEPYAGQLGVSDVGRHHRGPGVHRAVDDVLIAGIRRRSRRGERERPPGRARRLLTLARWCSSTRSEGVV